MKKNTLFLFVLSLLMSSVNAQIKISGKVMDGENPLPFATVSIKNTTTGVVTDEFGAFSIEAKKKDTLSFSCLGFKAQNVIIKKSDNLILNMISDNELDEVVVTGYSTTACTYTKGCCCYSYTIISNKWDDKFNIDTNRLYPNPATKGIFNLKLKPDYKNVKVNVTNMAGQHIKSFIFKTIDKTQIDLFGLPKGIYLVTIFNNGKRMETIKGILN